MPSKHLELAKKQARDGMGRFAASPSAASPSSSRRRSSSATAPSATTPSTNRRRSSSAATPSRLRRSSSAAAPLPPPPPVVVEIEKLQKELVWAEAELKQTRRDNRVLTVYIRDKKEEARKKKEEEARKKAEEEAGRKKETTKDMVARWSNEGQSSKK